MIAALLGLALVPLTLVHLRAVARQVSSDRLEAEMDEIGEVAWDLPDVIRRVPPGTRLVSPTSGYNGAEVMNYFAFADREARAKGITVVYLGEHYTGWHSDWAEGEVSTRSVGDGAGPICTLSAKQAQAFRRARATMTEIPREPLERPHAASIPRPSIYCSP